MTSTQSKLYAWWHWEVRWVCTTGAGSFRFIPKSGHQDGGSCSIRPRGFHGSCLGFLRAEFSQGGRQEEGGRGAKEGDRDRRAACCLYLGLEKGRASGHRGLASFASSPLALAGKVLSKDE